MDPIPAPAPFSTDRFIVKYKALKSAKGRAEITKALGNNIKSIRKIGNPNFELVLTKEKIQPGNMKDKLKKVVGKGNVEYIQPDIELNLAANDPYFGEQWGLHNQDNLNIPALNPELASDPELIDNPLLYQPPPLPETPPYRVDANVVPAWEEATGAGAVVAVLDTGIDLNHPDLSANIWTNAAEVPGNGIDDDANGYIDDVKGWDFFDNTNIVYRGNQSVDEWHGTHIAGIIAAIKDNNLGIAGIAPAQLVNKCRQNSPLNIDLFLIFMAALDVEPLGPCFQVAAGGRSAPLPG